MQITFTTPSSACKDSELILDLVSYIPVLRSYDAIDHETEDEILHCAEIFHRGTSWHDRHLALRISKVYEKCHKIYDELFY